MSQAVHLDVGADAGAGECWSQDGVAEPAVGDVAVGAAGSSRAAGVVVAVGAALGAVVGIGTTAVRATAGSGRIRREGSVAVAASVGVGFSQAQVRGVVEGLARNGGRGMEGEVERTRLSGHRD